MAVGVIAEKLYPPVINGSLPAFYSDSNGTAKIVVPFSMNRAVTLTNDMGFSLKIKTVQSNTLIAVLGEDEEIYHDDKEVIFSWVVPQKVKIGQFLKVQLAYRKQEGNETLIGYYSTVGIIKYTSKPNVYIGGFEDTENQGAIDIFRSEYTGIYETGEDKSERPYSYKFDLYNYNLSLVETSGWKLHNTSINNVASESMSLDKATDMYNFDTSIKFDTEYYLQYTVRTINNLEVSSPLYLCMEPAIEESNLAVNLIAENIFEEGYTQLQLQLKDNYFINDITVEEIKEKYRQSFDFNSIVSITETLTINNQNQDVINCYKIYNDKNQLSSNLAYQIFIFYDNETGKISSYKIYDHEVMSSNESGGKLINKISSEIKNRSGQTETVGLEICRAEKTDNFNSWKTLQKVYFSTYEEMLKWSFKDFCIEQGIIYKYCFRQCASNTIKSNRVESNEIMADFEDMFLYDGKKQVKIRFNPKVSSFKINRLENKTDTIGSKYPFIFRNGIVEYREFPISGLISYYMDNNELFINHAEDLNILLGSQSSRWMGTPVSSGLEKNNKTKDIEDNSNLNSWEKSQTLDSLGYNMQAERRFKLKLLDWLGNGEIKMFKSPAEGNFLVRLMNISLTPEDKVSRMIHTFSCTAYEVQEYTYNNLKDLGFLNISEQYKTTVESCTVNFYNSTQTGVLDQQLKSSSDIIRINGNLPIYEYVQFSIPPGGRLGNSSGFYIRLGMSSNSKILISPARGFTIDDPGNKISDIYFCPEDNLGLINIQDESNILNQIKELVGDTAMTFKYQTTAQITSSFNNIVDSYLENKVETVQGSLSDQITSFNFNSSNQELIKIYNITLKKKYIDTTQTYEIVNDNPVYPNVNSLETDTIYKFSCAGHDDMYGYVLNDSLYIDNSIFCINIFYTNNTSYNPDEEVNIINEEYISSLSEPVANGLNIAWDDITKISFGRGIVLDCAYLVKITRRS